MGNNLIFNTNLPFIFDDVTINHLNSYPIIEIYTYVFL